MTLLRDQVPATPTGDLLLHDEALEIGLAVNHSTYDTLYVAFALAVCAGPGGCRQSLRHRHAPPFDPGACSPSHPAAGLGTRTRPRMRRQTSLGGACRLDISVVVPIFFHEADSPGGSVPQSRCRSATLRLRSAPTAVCASTRGAPQPRSPPCPCARSGRRGEAVDGGNARDLRNKLTRNEKPTL